MIWAVAGAALLLLWPAVLNGFPLVFIDTVSFLAQTIVPRMAWDKPMAYGPFLHLGHWQVSLWGAAALQALVLSWLLWLVQRAVLGRITPAAHLLAVGLLAALTALPWFASTLMPDVFAGVTVLSLWLLALGRLSRAEGWAMLALGAFAVAVHLSHLVIAAAVIAGVLLLTWRLRPVLRATAPLAIALVFLLVSNGIGHGRLAISPYGATFALARLQADGPATALLRARCPDAGWYLCGFVDRLPMDSDQFLWDPASPVARDAAGNTRPMGTVLIAAEAAQIVAATLRAYPLEVLRAAAQNLARQLVTFRVGDTLVSDHLDVSARMMVAEGFSARELAAFDAAMQMRGALPAVAEPLLWPQAPVVALSLVIGLWAAISARGTAAQKLFACVLLGILANAAATGALSKPHHRYQARIIWLLPLAAGLLMARRLAGEDSPALPVTRPAEKPRPASSAPARHSP
ncbi:hypothetical protein ACQW02_19495 [Humitalea sp. 24SJ18S-53]|uniref:hypothetical protein n=1 Tax=Humitalea sp. 24SJ18S-53 TaxID=3422307 RepID=UPI003D66A31B